MTLTMDEAIFNDLPFVGKNHPPTAQRMAATFRTGSKKRAMAESFVVAGADGLTDYELEDLGHGSHQSVSGCRNSLVKAGLIEDSGMTRVNKFGNDCIVWRVGL